MSFRTLLDQRWSQRAFLCVGLDTSFDRIPDRVKQGRSLDRAVFEYNRDIVEATCAHACAFKPNAAFYEAYGIEGMVALRDTIAYIKSNHPEVPVILDAKRADIGSTNEGYVRAAFDVLGADAVTVHPYLGKEALLPFLERGDKGILVLVKTSNPGAGELQDLVVGEDGRPLYQVVAQNVATAWNQNGNCGVVVGATYPQDLGVVRTIVGELPILIPGVGAQGGELGAAVAAGKTAKSSGILINVSRGVVFASSGEDYADAAGAAAKDTNDEINKYM